MKKILLVNLTVLLLIGNLYAYKAVKFKAIGLSTQDKYMVMAIAGIVNREKAQLYLENVYETWSYNMTDENWAGIYEIRGQVEFEIITSVTDLISKFKDNITGAITYDDNQKYGNFQGQSFMWQGEYAVMLGSLTNRIPIPASKISSYGLTVSDSILVKDVFNGDPEIYVPGKLEDLKYSWNNATLTAEQRYLDLLTWAVKNVLPVCNPEKFYIREITDYTVQQRMFQVNLAGTNSLDIWSMLTAKADILENILNYLHSKNQEKIFHIYGWIHPEPMVQWLNSFGSSFHETLLSNLSWHTSFPVAERTFVPKSKINTDNLPLEDKYYVTIIGTEGDAGNWVVGFQSGAWLSADRGKVAVNWGWNLHLFDICPFIASYYYDTSTENDGFISVATPLGYAFPDLWTDFVWDNAVSESKRLMTKFNVPYVYGYKHYASAGLWKFRNKEISNSFNFAKYGAFQAATNTLLTFVFDPMLPTQKVTKEYSNTLIFNHVNDGTFYGVSNNTTTFANNILSKLKGKQGPYFLMGGYQRLRTDAFSLRSDPSDADISIPMLLEVVNKLKADPTIGSKIEVVTVNKFHALMQKKLITDIKDNPISQNEKLNCYSYPNPCHDFTTINYSISRSEQVKIEFIDLFGKTVLETNVDLKSSGLQQTEIDTKNLGKGIYIFKITTSDQSQTGKIIKE